MCGGGGVEPVQPVATDAPDAEFTEELRQVINRHSRENRSNTPDYILAAIMTDALITFELGVNGRDIHYNCGHKIGGGI